MSSLKYRPDIDGLRAIAVLSVILYHGEIALPGGFLGVDIFFVISGYLITRLLIAEYEVNQRISIRNFYERRVRRILPALCAVCIASTPFAYFLMLPESFASYLQSLLATQLFVSNIFFWTETGYFAAAAETKPLIHTWSLSVEEQFYLFFPLVFAYIVAKWTRQGLLRFALIGFVGSLLAAAWAFEHMRSAAFYLTPFRIWELFAGVIAAVSGLALANRLKDFAPALSFAGIVLLCSPLLVYPSLAAYPVPYMFAVVAGASLVIVFASQTAIGTILSLRPLVFVGKISYSAYLVHQPLFVFTRLYLPGEPPIYVDALLALLALVLGWVSWAAIEQPFRRGTRYTGKQIFKFGWITVTAICASAIAVLMLKPSSSWTTEALAYGRETTAGTYGLSPKCTQDWTLAECAVGENPRVFLWGDSYAMHLAPGLMAKGVEFRQAALPSCPPRAQPAYLEPTGNSYEKGCTRFNNKVVEYLSTQAKSGQITTVLLSSRDYGVRAGSLRKFPKEEPVDVQETDDQLKSTINSLKSLGLRVGVVGAPPAAAFDPAQCSLKVLAFQHDHSACVFPLTTSADGQRTGAVAKVAGVPYLNIAQAICHGGACNPAHEQIMLYRDNGHLLPEGARWLFGTPQAKAFLEELHLWGPKNVNH
jgi:peptidoglycan/LPS O-acetylase OafA/YrhL